MFVGGSGGFISGRSLSESILPRETAMGGVPLASREAAAVFLDVATAFPGLLHGWLFRF